MAHKSSKKTPNRKKAVPQRGLLHELAEMRRIALGSKPVLDFQGQHRFEEQAAKMQGGKPLYWAEDNTESRELLYEQAYTGRILSLHRPKHANALTTRLARQLTRAVSTFDTGAVTSFFIIKGSGVANLADKLVATERDKFFCSGTDLLQLRGSNPSAKNHDEMVARAADYYEAEAQLINTLVNVRKPWAAGMDGTVMGVGAGLAMGAVFRFASEVSAWALPETAYGSVPTYASSFFMPQLEGELGTYLALTGRRLVGHDLLWAGLASNMIDPDLYTDVCKSLTYQSSTEMQFVAPVIETYDVSATKQQEPFSLEPHLETIASCFRHDSVERIKEALREDGTDFARKTLSRLGERSPASLKLTLRLLREGRAADDVVKSLRTEHKVMMELWKDPTSDLHIGLEKVALAPPQPRGAKRKFEVKWPKDATDSYVDRVFAAKPSETLELRPLVPRPPTEAPQLLEYYGNVSALENAPQLDEAELQNKEQPEDFKGGGSSVRELFEVLRDGDEELVMPTTYWYVQTPEEIDEELAKEDSAEKKLENITVQATEFGEMFFARDVRTKEIIPLPEQIKFALLEKNPNLRDLHIFKVDAFDIHPGLEYSGQEFDESLEEGDQAMQDGLENLREHSKMAKIEADPDRIVSSHSIEELLARPHMDLDQEVAAYLELLGRKEEVPGEGVDEDEEDLTPQFYDEDDLYMPPIDKRPLTRRELLL